MTPVQCWNLLKTCHVIYYTWFPSKLEDAALNGIIPLLQKIVKTESPLKEFAQRDTTHSGRRELCGAIKAYFATFGPLLAGYGYIRLVSAYPSFDIMIQDLTFLSFSFWHVAGYKRKLPRSRSTFWKVARMGPPSLMRSWSVSPFPRLMHSKISLSHFKSYCDRARARKYDPRL